MKVSDYDGRVPEPPYTCPECDELRETVERQRAAFLEFAGYVISCRRKNTPEYMAGLEEYANRALEAFGDPDRFVMDSDAMRFWLKKGEVA